MGITIDADIYLLCSMFNISSKKLSDEYSGMSVEEIMEAEAKQGNTAAAKFDQSILGDPIKLAELFQLNDPGNKYAILSNMNEHDLENLLPLLNQMDLIQGLNFFTKDKLLQMISELPKEQLINLTFEMFSPEQLMQYMPDEEINKVLESSEMQKSKNFELKYLQELKPEILAQMIESVTGQEAFGVGEINIDGTQNFDKKALFEQLLSLPDDKFQDALLNMPPVAKQEFMFNMTQENPKIFELFRPDAFVNIIGQKKEKQDIIKASQVIESEQLVNMIEELPQDLTAVVLTQIDTSKFSNILLANFKNILSQIIAG